MERYEIEIFLALAEELHFARTAARLGLSPARVTQVVQKLERRIGAALFDRSSRRVELTTLGAQFRADLAPGYRQVRWAVERATMAARGFDGPFHVGYVGAAGGRFTLRLARAFGELHPTTEMTVSELQLGNSLEALHDRSIEMVLNSRPITGPDLVNGPDLWRDPRHLAVPVDHPFAARAAVSLEDLAEVTLIRMPEHIPLSVREDRVPERTPAGRPIAHGPVGYTFPEALTLVGAGEGAFTVGAQVHQFYQRPDVAYVPFSDAPPIGWGFLWRASQETARIRAFNAMAVRFAEPA